MPATTNQPPEPVTRYFALVIGVAFVAAGIGGFLPGVTLAPHANHPELVVSTSYGLLIGLYPVNVVHNLVHLVLGGAALLAFLGRISARGYVQALAVILAAFTVVGLLPVVNTTFGVLPLFGHAVWLHGLEAAAAGYLGFVHPRLAPRRAARQAS